MVALCGENIVNIVVFVKFHLFEKLLIFFTLAWLWGVIFAGLGDLCGLFCGFVDARKTIDILR